MSAGESLSLGRESARSRRWFPSTRMSTSDVFARDTNTFYYGWGICDITENIYYQRYWNIELVGNWRHCGCNTTKTSVGNMCLNLENKQDCEEDGKVTPKEYILTWLGIANIASMPQ